MAAGSTHLVNGFLLQKSEATLQVLDLSNGHESTGQLRAIVQANHRRVPGVQKGSFFLASLSRSASMSRRRLRIVS
jgi:hypothetical protein